MGTAKFRLDNIPDGMVISESLWDEFLQNGTVKRRTLSTGVNKPVYRKFLGL